MDVIAKYEWFALPRGGGVGLPRACLFLQIGEEASESDMHSFVLRLRADNGGSGKVKMTQVVIKSSGSIVPTIFDVHSLRVIRMT